MWPMLFCKELRKLFSVFWSDWEMAALVEYITLFHLSSEDPSSIWPTFKNDEFWGKCADAVNYYNDEKLN